MRKLLPIILILLGLGGGAGAGLMLKPAPVETVEINPCGDGSMAATGDKDHNAPEDEPVTDKEYVKLNNQFIVPVVDDQRIEALVVMSLSVEVEAGKRELIYAREPKLRDVFLQVLFDHANMGGFRGAFTNANNLDVLRSALRESARKALGETISDVLIMDIARQDS